MWHISNIGTYLRPRNCWNAGNIASAAAFAWLIEFVAAGLSGLFPAWLRAAWCAACIWCKSSLGNPKLGNVLGWNDVIDANVDGSDVITDACVADWSWFTASFDFFEFDFSQSADCLPIMLVKLSNTFSMLPLWTKYFNLRQVSWII